jgi:DNA polymerase-3 subunit delta
MPTVHAFEYLQAPANHPPAAINVLFGEEGFLRTLVLAKLRDALAAGRQDVQITNFDSEALWRDVNDELSTGSLFGGGGKRIVMIEDADDFVKTYREDRLEDYFAKPKSTAALILCVESWAANTRLYKAGDARGLQINCNTPINAKLREKPPDVPKISKWLVAWAKAQHKIALEGSAADELIGIEGTHLGMMDQDLGKLALYVPPGGKVTAAMVKDIVGGWRLRTVWQMLEDLADGKIAPALAALDHLLADTEPIALFGQVSWSLRRYAAATRIYQRSERLKQGMNVQGAAKEAGFKPYGDELPKAERHLKQMTRARSGKLYQWLLETDLALKNTHSQKGRSRFALEALFLKLAAR